VGSHGSRSGVARDFAHPTLSRWWYAHRNGAALRQNAHAAAVSTFHCVCEGAREIASILSTLGLLVRGGTLYLFAPVI
jgi:hypothetical protein